MDEVSRAELFYWYIQESMFGNSSIHVQPVTWFIPKTHMHQSFVGLDSTSVYLRTTKATGCGMFH